MLWALLLVTVPLVQAPHVEDPQVSDAEGDVDPLGAAGSFADLRAAWVSDESDGEIKFHVEVAQLPPAGAGVVTDPVWVEYHLNMTFVRPAAEGVPGFEEEVRKFNQVRFVAAAGISGAGSLISGGDLCNVNQEPSNTSRSDGDNTFTCTILKHRLLPDDLDTFHEGDRLEEFSATAVMYLHPNAMQYQGRDVAEGDGTYVFQDVEPRPEPTDEGGGDDGTGPADRQDGDDTDTSDRDDPQDSGPQSGDDPSPGEATPGPAAVAVVLALVAAVGLVPRRG